MYPPAFGPFHQIAWVTNDMERSVALFRDLYGVPSFFVSDQEFNARVGGERGVMKMRMGLANVDGVELELIQPVGGIDAIYRDVLPKDGTYANVFHHICVKVNGTLEDWDRHLGSLHAARKQYYEGFFGDAVRFVYTDERPFLGHYVEHVWYSPETWAYMVESVPRFKTTPP